jgi:hypothetical protein
MGDRATPNNTHDLAIALEPALGEACGGRLGAIEWFHAAWQRGGAATGFSSLRLREGETPVPVLVKLPVGPDEFRWTTTLGRCAIDAWDDDRQRGGVTPRVLACGQELGGSDIGWVVVERLGGDHLPFHMDEGLVVALVERVVDFHQAAAGARSVEGRARTPEWERLIDKGREMTKEAGEVPEHHLWHEALRKVHKALPTLRARWDARPIDTWCHGDVHPGNVLRRLPAGVRSPRQAVYAHEPWVLIDLALVHPGHWLEDALYLERQYWGHEHWLAQAKPLSIMARLRRERGLACDAHYDQLANVRRVLMAACAPAMIHREGNAKYMHAALALIDRLLPQAVK